MDDEGLNEFCLPVKAIHVLCQDTSLSQADLKCYFEKVGKVRSVKQCPEDKSFQIFFRHVWDAQRAVLELDGKYVRNAKLSVTLFRPTRSLWVGMRGVQKSHVVERFKHYGNIENIDVLRYNVVVHFTKVESAVEALMYEQHRYYSDGENRMILHVNFYNEQKNIIEGQENHVEKERESDLDNSEYSTTDAVDEDKEPINEGFEIEEESLDRDEMDLMRSENRHEDATFSGTENLSDQRKSMKRCIDSPESRTPERKRSRMSENKDDLEIEKVLSQKYFSPGEDYNYYLRCIVRLVEAKLISREEKLQLFQLWLKRDPQLIMAIDAPWRTDQELGELLQCTLALTTPQ